MTTTTIERRRDLFNGEYMRRLREAKGWTREVLADHARRTISRGFDGEPGDITASAIEYYEDHDMVPTTAFRVAVARALGAPLSDMRSRSVRLNTAPLRAARERLVSQRDLVELSGLTGEVIDAIESGDLTDVSVATLYTYMAALGTAADETLHAFGDYIGVEVTP